MRISWWRRGAGCCRIRRSIGICSRIWRCWGTLTEASDGKVIEDLDGIFAEKPKPVRTFWPLWQVLLLVVTGSLLVDIAWRRLNVADWFRPKSVGRGGGDEDGGERGGAQVGDGGAAGGADAADEHAGAGGFAGGSEGNKEPAVPPPLPGAGAFPVEPGATEREKVAEAPTGENYASRLLSAKKRAKEQIREHEEREKS